MIKPKAFLRSACWFSFASKNVAFPLKTPFVTLLAPHAWPQQSTHHFRFSYGRGHKLYFFSFLYLSSLCPGDAGCSSDLFELFLQTGGLHHVRGKTERRDGERYGFPAHVHVRIYDRSWLTHSWAVVEAHKYFQGVKCTVFVEEKD